MVSKKPSVEEKELELKRLTYQLDFLKIEINAIQDTIWRFIEITQTTKNWAVAIWAGSIGLLLGQQDLSKYLIFTAVLPMIFWYLDAHWRHLQRKTSFREMKIREFINDERLLKSFEERKIVDFIVYDPTGRQYSGMPDAENFSSRLRTFRYPELLWFYLPMILISVLAEIIFIYVPVK